MAAFAPKTIETPHTHFGSTVLDRTVFGLRHAVTDIHRYLHIIVTLLRWSSISLFCLGNATYSENVIFWYLCHTHYHDVLKQANHQIIALFWEVSHLQFVHCFSLCRLAPPHTLEGREGQQVDLSLQQCFPRTWYSYYLTEETVLVCCLDSSSNSPDTNSSSPSVNHITAYLRSNTQLHNCHARF